VTVDLRDVSPYFAASLVAQYHYSDCTWQRQESPGVRVDCGMPPFVAGRYVKLKQPSLFAELMEAPDAN